MKNLDPWVEHDERTDTVENASYLLGYVFLVFGLLFDACYRTFVRHLVSWDLVALVFGSFAICWVYQARQKILIDGWAKKLFLITLFGGVIGAIIGAIMAWSGITNKSLIALIFGCVFGIMMGVIMAWFSAKTQTRRGSHDI
jgi:membrane associated rhomboid family serine protease